jgi:hypothetical protein
MNAKHLINAVMNSVLAALGRTFSIKGPAHSDHQTSEWECMS